MTFPIKLTLRESVYALDGGTTVLMFVDEQNKEQTIVLNQHAYIPEPKYFAEGLPGRLYFNETLIEVRSPEEAFLLTLLKTAEVCYLPEGNSQGESIELSPDRAIFGDDLKQIFNETPEENLRSMLKDVIDFVESDEYIAFAEEVNRKSNEKQN